MGPFLYLCIRPNNRKRRESSLWNERIRKTALRKCSEFDREHSIKANKDKPSMTIMPAWATSSMLVLC